MKKLIAMLLALLMLASLMTGCASKETTPAQDTETKTDAAPADTNSAEETTDAEPTENPYAEQIAECIASFEQEQSAWTEWTGPTTGPKIAEGKKICIINQDSSNGGEALWGDQVAEACETAGWEYVIMDGQGDYSVIRSCFSQAIATGCDGIVTSADAQDLQTLIEEALSYGIPTVGIHASDVEGPVESLNLLYNNTSDPVKIGNAIADYAIADSNGTGRVVIVYNATHAIANAKGEAMKARIESVGMEILEMYSVGDDVASTLPSKMSGWIATYGDDFYVLSVGDALFDFMIPSIRSAGAEHIKLVGADGENAAYDRIRNNDYQVATVPEPGSIFGYMCVDELNRYFNGEEQVVWHPQMHIVTTENVDEEGGLESRWVPDNNFAEEYKKIWGIS